MNIRLDEDSILIRITENEFRQLKTSGQISYNFNYWPIQVNLQLLPESKIGRISSQQLNLCIAESEVDLLLTPQFKKSGLKLIAYSTNNIEIIVDLQVDLHR